MKSLSRVRGGHKARIQGSQFENILEIQCRMQGIHPTKIKTFARFLAQQRKWIPEKAPFDFILTHETGVAFIDCKTIKTNSFKKTQGQMDIIKRHQEMELLAIEEKKHKAGFLVWFRNANAIVFFPASVMVKIHPNDPITPAMGEYLGTYESFALGNLFI